MKFKVIYYHFTPEEVYALHRLILRIGWIPHDDESIIAVVNRICKISDVNELVTADNQAT